MRTSSTRREAIKTALKAGAYATPVPIAVAAVTSPLSMSADLFFSAGFATTGIENGVFSVVVLNRGPNPASTVVVTITHSATLRLVPFAVTQGAFDLTTGIWSVGTVPLTGRISPPVPDPAFTVPYAGTGKFTLAITSSTPGPNPANNTGSFPVI